MASIRHLRAFHLGNGGSVVGQAQFEGLAARGHAQAFLQSGTPAACQLTAPGQRLTEIIRKPA